MKFFLSAWLILLGMTSTTVIPCNQKLLASDALSVRQTKNKLDFRIRPPDTRKYKDVIDGNDWLNPYLVIRPEGIGVIWRVPAVERRVIPRNELKKVLISLPVAAWPYGRVVGVQEISIRSGTPNSEIWLRDEKLIEKNRLEANRTLASLGIKINWWPSN